MYADRNISIPFLTQSGRFLARVIGESREMSFCERCSRISDNEEEATKIYNHKSYYWPVSCAAI
ncbi:hypothetical protein EHV15_10545 [Paenibacillus oralis]|uniref:Uncharacterized protein n=1 Tax=Paenibacillus oralis TaxID=2490856 RepID=A0A3P3TZN5_9BACL|nr:hypothetical protein EHV15_10545 [Paenibacillus oralis]